MSRFPEFCFGGRLRKWSEMTFFSLMYEAVGSLSAFFALVVDVFGILFYFFPILFQSLIKRRNHKALLYQRKWHQPCAHSWAAMAISQGQTVSQKVSHGLSCYRWVCFVLLLFEFGVYSAPVASFQVCLSEDKMCQAHSLFHLHIFHLVLAWDKGKLEKWGNVLLVWEKKAKIIWQDRKGKK